MANSFISINGNGFWAYDILIEGIQLMLIEELSNSEYEIFDWISEYKLKLTIQSLPIIYGGMSMEFDEYLISEDRKQIVLFAIHSLTKKLEKSEAILTEKRMFQLRQKAINSLANSDLGNFKGSKEIDKTIHSSYWSENSSTTLNKQYYIKGLNMLARLLNGKIDDNDEFELLKN